MGGVKSRPIKRVFAKFAPLVLIGDNRVTNYIVKNLEQECLNY